MVFVGDEPPSPLPSQSEGQAQSVVRVVVQLLWSSAAQQGVREGDVLACGHLQGHNLERRPLTLPGEERRPRLAIGLDAPYAVAGWWHVEHHDVVGVVGEN